MNGTDSEFRVGEAEDENGAIGIFPSWGWLYGAVVVYTVLAIALLHVFTVTFDYGLQ